VININFKRIRKRILDKINNKIKQSVPAASARPTVPFETVYDGLAAGVEVVVLGLDDAVVHVHGWHGELAGLAELIEPVDPCHALFHDTLHRGSDLIRIEKKKAEGSEYIRLHIRYHRYRTVHTYEYVYFSDLCANNKVFCSYKGPTLRSLDSRIFLEKEKAWGSDYTVSNYTFATTGTVHNYQYFSDLCATNKKCFAVLGPTLRSLKTAGYFLTMTCVASPPSSRIMFGCQFSPLQPTDKLFTLPGKGRSYNLQVDQ
jgi:hypothetical protein